MDYLIDTGFLIGRWRDGERSREQAFILANPDAVVGLPWVVKAEFLRGAALAGHPNAEVRGFVDRHRVIWPDEETLDIYAGLYASLLRANSMIGPHDLWIAAAALRVELPLLTRNVQEFRRVPNLRVQKYSRSTDEV